MATYTDNYNLTKPTMNELADIRVINGNMDTVDEIMHGSQVSIADAYDPTLTYDVGNLVMNDFLLYKCVTAVSTPEAFDANKWTRATAIGEIQTDTFTGATSQMAGDKGLVPAPSAGDQNKYLKANGTWDTPSSGGGGGGIDYSTTEQNTGLKWIDGKDIYQITIQTSLPLVATDGTMAYADISFTGVDSVIKLVAQFSDTNSVYFTPYLSNGLRIVKTYYNKSTQKIMLATDSVSFSEVPCIITIQYTKATTP